MNRTKRQMAELTRDAERVLENINTTVVEWDLRPLWRSGKTLVLGATSAEGPIVVQRKRMSKERLALRIGVLEEAQSALESFRNVSVPVVLAYDLDRRVVIMSRAPGETVTQFLVSRSRDATVYPEYSWLFEASARALAIFHSSMPSDSSSNVRLHLDFGPQNVLVDAESRHLTLIDLPDKKCYGRPEQDLGLASLEWLRLSLRRPTPSFVQSLSRGRREFIAQYKKEIGGRNIDLKVIHNEEKRRLSQLFSVAGKFAKRKYGWVRVLRFFPMIAGLMFLKFILVPFQQRLERSS